jgi:hypothetical protein
VAESEEHHALTHAALDGGRFPLEAAATGGEDLGPGADLSQLEDPPGGVLGGREIGIPVLLHERFGAPAGHRVHVLQKIAGQQAALGILAEPGRDPVRLLDRGLATGGEDEKEEGNQAAATRGL